MWGAAPILFRCARCSGTLAWARPAAATPAGAGPAAPPPPASRSLRGGGRPHGSRGGGGLRLWLPSLGGVRGEGWPPRPVGRRPAFRCPRCAIPGYTRASGVAGRPRASGAVQPTGQCGGGGGGGKGGGNPPALVRAPVGRQQAGRVGPCLGRCAPAPRVQRPLRGGCGAAVSSVRLRPLLGLSGRGGGEWGGPLVPWQRLLTARGGAAWRSPPREPAIGWGVAPFPRPPLELDPRAGPRWGLSSPRLSSRGAGRPVAAVRVSGQRLAGCGAAGSPPRSLSPPSLPREVARSPASCRTVGGGVGRGAQLPPHFLASAVWAVTCAAACVGAGAVAAAGCAGGSASGRGRCARPGGASCWRPHP